MTEPMPAHARGGPTSPMYGVYLARVESTRDPENLARVQVKLLGFDGVEGQDGPIWARVALPFAGASRGAFMIPSRGDEVAVQFVAGDVRQPIVVGSLWNGKDGPTEQLGGDGATTDRWTLTGKDGSRIAIIEEQSGSALISLEVAGDVSASLKQENGGKIEIKAAGATITVDTQGITLEAPSKVKVQAAQVDISAAKVNVDAALSNFSGIVKASVIQATTVIGSTYTPGAGNIW
jgi:uncharacterized protein involved in type VI secretion and phage assembly